MSTTAERYTIKSARKLEKNGERILLYMFAGIALVLSIIILILVLL